MMVLLTGTKLDWWRKDFIKAHALIIKKQLLQSIIRQLDVKNAFLRSTLSKDVFTTQPQGFVYSNSSL